ncbi:acetyltransferase, partial [Glutamicibacter ardleyensis]|uniref:acetyltransferase n=1 Tax=Glutamicibacter ardleyensis TaxID=225894 RepID=UPI003FD0CC9E
QQLSSARTMTENLIVVGAGGFGRETLDIIEAINDSSPVPAWRVLGIVDDQPAGKQLARIEERGYSYLGTCSSALARYDQTKFTIGIGSPEIRAHLAQRFESEGWTAPMLIHPAASIGSRVSFGEGTIVAGGVQLSTNIRLGRFVHVNPGAIIGHDVTMDEFVSINPGAVVSGEVHIHSRVLVGAGAVVLQGLDIGTGAIIGAGACLTKNAWSNSTLKGVPAR